LLVICVISLESSRSPPKLCTISGKKLLMLKTTQATLTERGRGMRCRRVAERLAPIEIVWDEPHGWRTGGRRSHVGRLEPPILRSAPLGEIEFRLRESTA